MRVRMFSAAVAALSMMAAGAAPAQTTSPSDCTAMWKQADISSAGGLTKDQAKAYVTDFTAVDTDKDGKITNTEFMKGCSAGHVRKMSAAGSSGTSGSGTSGSGTGSSGSGSSGSGGAQPMPSR